MALPRWLTPWRRRTPVPQGRHVRTSTPVVVPGAGSALVAAAAEPALVEAAELSEPPDPAPDPAPAAEPVGEPTGAPQPVVPPDGTLETVEPTAPGPASGAAVPLGGTVSLGFSDGAEVRLDADDPRVAALRAAADAVLEAPETH